MGAMHRRASPAVLRRGRGGDHIARMDLDFTEEELRRYSRHILLAEVGAIGQARLRAARVLVVGAGGLGSPLALYLAAAGIGTIGLVDHDALELSNLQRQVAHATARLGRNKAESAAETLAALNPEVRVEVHARRMDAEAARELIPRYDIVCDGTDNFATRFLLGDACHLLGRPLVSAAVLRFEGQLSVFRAMRARRIPATAACTPSRRRRAWCRPAPRPACSAPSPA
jgi:molybdopterin/thiamine biosynthesis adenylyltransferase